MKLRSQLPWWESAAARQDTEQGQAFEMGRYTIRRREFGHVRGIAQPFSARRGHKGALEPGYRIVRDRSTDSRSLPVPVRTRARIAPETEEQHRGGDPGCSRSHARRVIRSPIGAAG